MHFYNQVDFLQFFLFFWKCLNFKFQLVHWCLVLINISLKCILTIYIWRKKKSNTLVNEAIRRWKQWFYYRSTNKSKTNKSKYLVVLLACENKGNDKKEIFINFSIWTHSQINDYIQHPHGEWIIQLFMNNINFGADNSHENFIFRFWQKYFNF